MTAHLYFFRPVQDSNPGLLAVDPVCHPSTTQPQDANLHESFVHVTYSCGSVLLWWRCNTLYVLPVVYIMGHIARVDRHRCSE